MSLNNSAMMPRVTTGFLNTQDDPVPGLSAQGTTATSQQFLGQLGAMMQLNHEAALALSKTSIGTLYAGRYQYVKFKAGTTAAPAKGLAAFWDDLDDYVVTPDAPATNVGFAGVILSANTKGNYGWIQVDGLATCKFKSTVTKSGAAAGDLVVMTTTANTFDVLADATALTSINAKLAVGVAWEAPTDAGLKLVHMNTRILNH